MAEKRDWSIETEGRVAQLLRALARHESEAERRPVIDELQRLTALDFGPNLGKWLGWYLEDHLGMRNAINILLGKTTEQEAAEPVALEDEQVFARAEYNWCALERIKNKDEMQKLRMLYSDLESPIQTEAEGPFSFRRLSGADQGDRAFFQGKSISAALFAEDVQVRHLRVLKDYGKMMMMPLFPGATQRTGAIVYAAAISQALVRFDTKVTSLSYKDLTESLPGLLERPYIVKSYSDLFRAALAKCG